MNRVGDVYHGRRRFHELVEEGVHGLVPVPIAQPGADDVAMLDQRPLHLVFAGRDCLDPVDLQLVAAHGLDLPGQQRLDTRGVIVKAADLGP